MPLSTRAAGLLRALIYPVQFDADPRDGVERVLTIIVDRGALDGTPAEYLAAIRDALSGDDALAGLIPQDHDEATIRRYLAEVASRLEARPRGP